MQSPHVTYQGCRSTPTTKTCRICHPLAQKQYSCTFYIQRWSRMRWCDNRVVWIKIDNTQLERGEIPCSREKKSLLSNPLLREEFEPEHLACESSLKNKAWVRSRSRRGRRRGRGWPWFALRAGCRWSANGERAVRLQGA